MLKLYSYDFIERMKFIFNMYDFDNDGIINKNDVYTLLKHFSFYI